MSAWERSRRIPWSTVVQDAQLEKDAEFVPPPLSSNDSQGSVAPQLTDSAQKTPADSTLDIQDNESGLIENTVQKKNIFGSSRTFGLGDLFRDIVFGVSIGSITGTMFGFMDSMKQSTSSKVLRNASAGAKMKFLVDGSVRTGSVFGGFFGGYHVMKYGVRTVLDPGQFTEIALSGAGSLGVVMYKPNLRMYFPYAGMLVLMDAFQTATRDTGGMFGNKKD
mmetsp:Transcript_50892/g.99567  ORF Transcript_50892/g.99567 Transcript_50892/m.99567 type:complete len:221 (+) Transcript_50892:147-809(+)